MTENAAVEVTLTMSELRLAAEVGVQRQMQNIKAERVDRYGADSKDGWTLHIEGAAGEMAVAKYLNRYWSGSLGNLGAADVDRYQVRTALQHGYRLLLHPEDSDNAPFILATGPAPRLTLHGWIRGRDGKRPEYWADPLKGRPAFFVPQSALAPMGRLQMELDR